MHKYNGMLIERAKALRKEMTPSERKLWYLFLSKQKTRFQRQKVIGNYIVDFYCDDFKLVVELDGSQHYEDDSIEYDRRIGIKCEASGTVLKHQGRFFLLYFQWQNWPTLYKQKGRFFVQALDGRQGQMDGGGHRPKN